MSVAVVDCPRDERIPTLRIAGMTLLERHVRELRREGADTILVRGGAGLTAAVDALGADVEWLPPESGLPEDARIVAGDQLLGIEIRDDATRRRAEWALMQSCRRSYDGPGDRYLGRPISLRITRLLTRWPIRPNHVTCVSFALGIGAGVLVATGNTTLLPVAAALLFASWILDSVDGELARVRYQGSHAGMVLDNVSDDILDNVLTVCLGFGLGGVWLPIAAGAAAARLVAVGLTYEEVARAGKSGDVMAFRWWFESGESTDEVLGNLANPLTLIRSLGRRDTYVVIYVVSLAAGAPLVALGLAVANGVGYGALALLHLALRGRVRQ